MHDIKMNGMVYTGKRTKQDQNYIHVYHCIAKYVTEATHLEIVVEMHN